MRIKTILKSIILDNVEIINRLPTINKIGGGGVKVIKYLFQNVY